jgi:hypothetical protein
MKDGKKAPKWIQWIGRAVVNALVKIADRDQDGRVEPGEILELVVELLEPHLEAHPDVKTP